MGDAGKQPIRRGDKGFVLRLLGGFALVVLLGVVVLGLLDRSRLGSCAARGFLQVTQDAGSED